VTYQLPNTPGTYKVSASASGIRTLKFTETAQ
jgi:hypothetical protein